MKRKKNKLAMLATAVVGVVMTTFSSSAAAEDFCGIDVTGLPPECVGSLLFACNWYNVEISQCAGLPWYPYIACLATASQNWQNEVNRILASEDCSDTSGGGGDPEPPAMAYAVAVNIAAPNLFRDLDLWRH